VSGNSIKLKEIEMGPWKAKTTEKTEGDPAPFTRFVMGEGKLDFTQNENELVNLGEKLWKWKTVQDYAKEVDSKPWFIYIGIFVAECVIWILERRAEFCPCGRIYIHLIFDFPFYQRGLLIFSLSLKLFPL
jgi:hypothetical protein